MDEDKKKALEAEWSRSGYGKEIELAKKKRAEFQAQQAAALAAKSNKVPEQPGMVSQFAQAIMNKMSAAAAPIGNAFGTMEERAAAIAEQKRKESAAKYGQRSD